MIDQINALLLLALVLLSSIDGLYLHLWKYRLQERPESRREHRIHSLRAVLFLALLLLLSLRPQGLLLYGLLLLLALDFFVGIADVLEEKASRRSLGGLSREEYLLHVVLVTLHSAVLSLSLVAGIGSAGPSASLAGLLLPGTGLVALLHLWLICAPLGLRRLEASCACLRPEAGRGL